MTKTMRDNERLLHTIRRAGDAAQHQSHIAPRTPSTTHVCAVAWWRDAGLTDGAAAVVCQCQ